RHDKGDHRAVVRAVRRDVEYGDATQAGDRVTNRGHHVRPPTLGEIRDAFDELHRRDGRGSGMPTTLWLLNCAISHACMVGLPAMIAVRAIDAFTPARSVTTPPASRMSRMPAATSHGASSSSQNASKRPHATSARSSAAEPARRMPAVVRINAGSVWRYSSTRSCCLNGKPVPISARPGSTIDDTWIV